MRLNSFGLVGGHFKAVGIREMKFHPLDMIVGVSISAYMANMLGLSENVVYP